MTFQLSSLDITTMLSILAVLVPFMASLAGALYRFALEQLPSAKAAALRARIGEVVRAVDRANATSSGVAKKQIALTLLAPLAKQHGVSYADLNVLIDSSVELLRQAQGAAVSAPSAPSSPSTMATATPLAGTPSAGQ